jgi:hypothetical protein
MEIDVMVLEIDFDRRADAVRHDLTSGPQR